MTLNTIPSLRHPRTGKLLTPVGFTAAGRAVWPMFGADETDPLVRLNELSARLTDETNPLTDAELAELRSILATEVQAVESAELTDDTLEHISRVADLAEAAASEATSRTEAAAERTRLRDAALERARGAIPAPEQTDEPAETVDVTAPAEQTEQTPEPVAASSRPRPVPLSQLRQTARPSREPQFNGQTDGRVRGTLVASSGPTEGRDFGADRDEQLINMAEAFDNAFRDVRSARGNTGRVLIASSRYSVSEEKLQSKGAADANRAAMDLALKAVTASGGICHPVTVDYNIPTWVNVEEPIKAALPSIDAPRGGLQYMNPVVYDATVYGAGVGVWSEPNDRNPGGSNTGPLSNPTGSGVSVKPCLEFDCSGSTEVDVEAITQCIQISNFRGRFSPENVQASMGYLEEAFAAKAEIERLKQMRNAAKHVTVVQAFGVSRDLLNFFDRVRAYFRSRYRLSDNVPLRVILNAYVREALRIDLRKAAFPYEGDTGNSLFVTDQMIDAWFASVGLSPVWALDDDQGDQTFAAASAGTLGSPSTFPWFPVVGHGSPGATTINIRALVYPEGTFQRLDGGELNLGVVRDSALNAVNKYQVFSEIFEAVAFRGFEAIDFQGSFIASGATAGTISPA